MSIHKEVKIMSRNFIDSYSTITSSHGGTTSYLYDRDNLPVFKSSNAKRDNITVELNITFNVGTTETAFKIDNILLLNTNVKDFEVYKYSNGAYTSIFQGAVNSGKKHANYVFGEITTSRLKIKLYNTQDKFNREKEIGELIACNLRKVLCTNPSQFSIVHREKKQVIELANGSRHISYTKFSTSRLTKYGASLGFNLLTEADVNFLYCLKQEAQPFLLYPESYVKPQEIYYVNWTNNFNAKYSSEYKNAGYDLTMEVEEV